MSVHSRNDREWRDVIAPRIKRRDGFFCTIRAEGCEGDRNLSIDHHVPRSKGGSDEDDNLFTACRSCNSRKSNKTITRIEWAKDGWFE